MTLDVDPVPGVLEYCRHQLAEAVAFLGVAVEELDSPPYRAREEPGDAEDLGVVV